MRSYLYPLSPTNNIIHVPILFTWYWQCLSRLSFYFDGAGMGCNKDWTHGKMQWTAQTLQLCLVQIELKCFKSGTKLKLFLTFLSINYQKAGGGFSPIRVNNRIVLSVPLPKPEDEFDLLIGDWNSQSHAQDVTAWPNGIVATPKMVNAAAFSNLGGMGVLPYLNSSAMATGPLPSGPGPFDIQFSINQARPIKWILRICIFFVCESRLSRLQGLRVLILKEPWMWHWNKHLSPLYQQLTICLATQSTSVVLAKGYSINADIWAWSLWRRPQSRRGETTPR